MNLEFSCVVPVNVAFGDKFMSTYAFLYQEFTHSFCANSLVQKLGISSKRENCILKR